MSSVFRPKLSHPRREELRKNKNRAPNQKMAENYIFLVKISQSDL